MKLTLLLLCLVPAMFVASAADSSVGYLKVKVSPDKAGVFVDGQYFGPAARFASTEKYLIAPGKHVITMVDPRCEEATATVQIEAGKTATINQTLKPLPEPKEPFGTLKVISKYNQAAVIINDHYVGHVDEFDNAFQGLLINPGTYSVRIDLAGGQTVLSQQVTIAAGKTTVVQ